MTPSAALAQTVVDELVRLGVREVVLAPGSRSAPVAYALHAADAAGRLRLHVRVDERSAAFLALGIGKATGMPAPVVTTSGTAVANLHPAVLEAHESGVPMLLLTADRPQELRGTRANQTTDQLGLFGAAVRWFHDLGVPEARAGAHAAWRTGVDRAVAAATGLTGGDPGPVHLNVPLRDPLAPDVDGGVDWPESLDGRADGAPWTTVTPRAHRASQPPLAHVDRTLVVLGHGDADLLDRAADWAARRGYPVVGEPFGHGRALPHGVRLAADADRSDLLPDRVVVAGRITLSRAIARLLRLPGVHVDLVTDDTRWPDPGHVVHAVHGTGVFDADDEGVGETTRVADTDGSSEEAAGDTGSFARAWADASATTAGDAGSFVRAWANASAAVGAAIEAGLSWPSGPALADAVLDGIPAGSVLFLGSSNGVRHVELVRGLRGDDGLDVVASRGLAGIDGCVSTAAGIALTSGRPTYAFLGDLTFLHDTNGLLIGPDEPRVDLTIVVGNDDGGAIFSDLEYGRADQRSAHPGVLERVFRTSTGTDLAALAAAHGVRHVRAESRAELTAALSQSPWGITLVEVPL